MGTYNTEIEQITDAIFDLTDQLEIDIDTHNYEVEHNINFEQEDPFVPDDNYVREQEELQKIFDSNNVYDEGGTEVL